MINIKKFVFNPVQVNTYLLWDSSNECVIVDPACSNEEEEKNLADFISDQNLKVVKVVNTHAHFDHIWGNQFALDRWGVALAAHSEASLLMKKPSSLSEMLGFDKSVAPGIDEKLAEGDIIKFGESLLEVIHVPGHSPGSILLYNEVSKALISGDVLFNGSIGRTDLEYGDYDTLISGIKSKVITLPVDTVVFPGHGGSTTVADEIGSNPYLQ